MSSKRLICPPLFTAVVIEHEQLQDEVALARFFAGRGGGDGKAFSEVFSSTEVSDRVRSAEALTRSDQLGSVPEFVVNGKYRGDPMRAGGHTQMIDVIDFRVAKERASLTR